MDAEAEAKEAAADVSGRDCTRRLASRKNKMRMIMMKIVTIIMTMMVMMVMKKTIKRQWKRLHSRKNTMKMRMMRIMTKDDGDEENNKTSSSVEETAPDGQIDHLNVLLST